MIEKLLDVLIKPLSERALLDGGFSGRIGGRYRPDATAWAALALAAVGVQEDLTQSARSRLAADQMEDGRLSVSPGYPQAFWPTPLAVIAWHRSPAHRESQSRALDFLLGTTGKHWKKRSDSPVGHDTAIRGWPWIEGTHSWVEPSSMVLLALELTGHGDHERAQEARRMLLDRQLERGGWNHGNTTVFCQELRPMPTSTGLALNALAGRLRREHVEKSLWYLKDQLDHLCTPLSLGWSLLGLGAWGVPPSNVESSVLQCFDRQQIYGPYDTQQLSLLLVSLLGKRGLLSIVT